MVSIKVLKANKEVKSATFLRQHIEKSSKKDQCFSFLRRISAPSAESFPSRLSYPLSR
jgi:hypothetical protein